MLFQVLRVSKKSHYRCLFKVSSSLHIVINISYSFLYKHIICNMPLFYLASRVCCDFIAFTLPAYASYKALKSRNQRELVPWLMYWVVMGIFSALETIADIFVFWLPFYYEFKMIFVVWLILPQTRGHIIIYRYLIHPTLERHEQTIDGALDQAQSRAIDVGAELGKKGLMLLGEYTKTGILKPATDFLSAHVTDTVSNNPQLLLRKESLNDKNSEGLNARSAVNSSSKNTTSPRVRRHSKRINRNKQDAVVASLMQELDSKDYL